VGFFNDFRTRRAIAAMEERLETVERQLKGLRLDWEGTYDKMHRMAQRIAKRAERAEELAAPEADTPPLSNGADTPTGGSLTPHQRQIQQDILRRRARI